MDEKRRARRARILDKIRKTPPEPLGPPDSHDQAEVAAMLREIGIALLEVEQPTQLVTARLLEIAAQYTTQPVRIVVLPTVLMIQVGIVGYEVDTSTTYSLQLDMAGRIDDIATLASVGAITPADAIEATNRARNLRPRFGPVTTTLGYAVTTIGFGMVINPTWASLPGYLFLGLVVGAIAQLGRPFPSLSPVLPTLAATVVTVLATWFVADTANDGLLRVIAPALVAMLPGMALTIGAMELASNQLIGGTSRLVYGVAQLALLVFGVAFGVHVAGAGRAAGGVGADGLLVVVRGDHRRGDRALRLSVRTARVPDLAGGRDRGRAWLGRRSLESSWPQPIPASSAHSSRFRSRCWPRGSGPLPRRS